MYHHGLGWLIHCRIGKQISFYFCLAALDFPWLRKFIKFWTLVINHCHHLHSLVPQFVFFFTPSHCLSWSFNLKLNQPKIHNIVFPHWINNRKCKCQNQKITPIARNQWMNVGHLYLFPIISLRPNKWCPHFLGVMKSSHSIVGKEYFTLLMMSNSSNVRPRNDF